MALMAPQPQPSQPANPPANIGSSEQDMSAPGLGNSSPAPSGGSPNMAPNPAQINQPGSGEPDMSPSQPDQQGQTSDIQQRLDALPDHDKAFLAQYLSPEFNYAVGLIAGPDVAQYLNQFSDPNKVLVPVNRQEAARIQQAIQQDKGSPQGAPQGADGRRPSQERSQRLQGQADL